jgi:hypothetical protein
MKKLITVVVLMMALVAGVFADDVDDHVNWGSKSYANVAGYFEFIAAEGWTFETAFFSSGAKHPQGLVVTLQYDSGKGMGQAAKSDYVQIVVYTKDGAQVMVFKRPE